MNQMMDLDKKLETKLFYVLAGTAVIANTIGYITNGLIYGMTHETIFNFLCAIVIYIATIIGIVSEKKDIPIFMIWSICNFIEFPVMYCLHGADRLSYMILGVVSTVLFLKGRWKAIASAIVIILDGGIILWSSMNSTIFFVDAYKDSPIAALMNFVIAGASIVTMLVILLSQYQNQREELQTIASELEIMAQLDPLTKLFNRRYLTEYIDSKIKNGDSGFSVALLDIDDFKKINDNYGHIYGDETLQVFADSMKKHIAGHGIAARYGGEEFMLVFKEEEKEEIEIVLKKIADDIEEFGEKTKQIHISFSGGVETFHNEDKIVKLFHNADEKLYCAKHRGKNQVVFSSAEKIGNLNFIKIK